MQRRQAELDRAEREARAREEAALREMAEAEAKAERDRVERDRAENLAARNAPEITGGEWFMRGTEILTTVKIAGCAGTGHNDSRYYEEGALLAESVWRPADAHVMAAAHDMFDLLNELVALEGPQPGTNEWANKVIAVLKKATYVPEVQLEAQAA
jgi:hypothetical protein